MATHDQRLIPRPGGGRLAVAAARAISVVSVVGVACGVAGTWSTALAAQDHAPSTHKAVPAPAKAEPRKAEPKKVPTPGPGNASQAATPPTGHGTSEPQTAAVPTVHADDDVEHAVERAATPQPAKVAAQPARSKELDAVMQRINRRISGGTGTTSAPAAATATAATAARSVPSARPRTRTQPPVLAATTSRVRLTWRPTVVWPAAVLGDADRRVDVAWVPEVR